MTNKVAEVEVEVEERDDIASILDAISKLDDKELSDILAISDYTEKKVKLAQLVIKQAHSNNELQNVTSSDTMREKLYSMIAYNTKKAIKKERQRETKQAIKSDAKIANFFSKMYEKAYKKNIA